jgi:predicted flavoprotein YhiN
LLDTLTRFQFPIAQDRGWNYAEVTAGGVPLEEINFRTMESKLVPNLYLIGEILDCDGRIGGFNFQWAWATGFLGGKSATGKPSRPVETHGFLDSPEEML